MKLIGIFNGNPFQARMVKNILENEGVESFLKDEIMARSPVFRPEGGVRVIISDLNSGYPVNGRIEMNYRPGLTWLVLTVAFEFLFGHNQMGCFRILIAVNGFMKSQNLYSTLAVPTPAETYR